MFQGILIDKDESGYRATLQQINEDQLPEGDVTVRVAYSTLNFKDGLAITGSSPVVRKFPMVPGIDLAGTVRTSDHPEWKTGDKVVLNGWGVGEGHWGGLAQKARLKGDWLIALPEAFTEAQAMAIGTAGYTAMLCIMALERNGVTPDQGEVLVTGANGGVGSFAIALLSKLGGSDLLASPKQHPEDEAGQSGECHGRDDEQRDDRPADIGKAPHPPSSLDRVPTHPVSSHGCPTGIDVSRRRKAGGDATPGPKPDDRTELD